MSRPVKFAAVSVSPNFNLHTGSSAAGSSYQQYLVILQIFYNSAAAGGVIWDPKETTDLEVPFGCHFIPIL